MVLDIQSTYPRIVCFGDSQTQQGNSPGGFVSRLADAYQRKADVITRGFNGYTTRDAAIVAKHIFRQGSEGSASPVLAVIVWLGCNDSIEKDQQQHVDPDDFVRNMRNILSVICGSSEITASSVNAPEPPYVVVLGPTPVTQRPFHSNDAKVRYTSRARQAITVDDRKNVVFVDLYDIFMSATRPLDQLLDHDGLHISPLGYELVFDAVFGALCHQAVLDPAQMHSQFPDWESLDCDRVEEQVRP